MKYPTIYFKKKEGTKTLIKPVSGSVPTLIWPVDDHEKPLILTGDFYRDVRREYPDVDIEAELENAHDYYMTRPSSKVRSRRNLKGFLMSWLRKHQQENDRALRWFVEVDG